MIANIDFLLKEGFKLGAKAGLYLATAYFILWGLSSHAHSRSGDPGEYYLAGLVLFLFGVLPVSLFGGITGMVIGEVFFWLKKQLPLAFAALTGLIISGGVVLFLFRPQLVPPPYFYYSSRYYSLNSWWHTNLLFPLLPGLIYILTSTWVALRLNRLNVPPTPWPRLNTYVNDSAINYIKDNYANFTRYDIDLSLINAGVSGAEVECAWKLVEFEAQEEYRKKQRQQTLGVIRVRGVKVDLDFWATIPFFLFFTGGLLYLLPFVVMFPIVIVSQLAAAVYFSSHNRTLSAISLITILVMSSLSYFA